MRGKISTGFLVSLAVLGLAIIVVAAPLIAQVRGPARESSPSGLSTSGGTMTGPIDMANNVIENIGAPTCDFTATGGLVLADSLDMNGNPIIIDTDGDSTIDQGIDDHIRIRPAGGTVAEFDPAGIGFTQDVNFQFADINMTSADVNVKSNLVTFGTTLFTRISGTNTNMTLAPAGSTAMVLSNTEIDISKPMDFQATNEQLNNKYLDFSGETSVPAVAADHGTLWVDDSVDPARLMFKNENDFNVQAGNHVIQSEFSQVTSDTSTGATTYGAPALLTDTITATGANFLEIHVTVSAANDNANQAYQIRVLVDSVSVGGTSAELRSAGVASSVSYVIRTAVAAGARTVEIQWKTSGGTLRCRPVANADEESATMLIHEVM